MTTSISILLVIAVLMLISGLIEDKPRFQDRFYFVAFLATIAALVLVFLL